LKQLQLIQILPINVESAVEPGDIAAKTPAVNQPLAAPNAAKAGFGHADNASGHAESRPSPVAALYGSVTLSAFRGICAVKRRAWQSRRFRAIQEKWGGKSRR
jgi:hypothetical protein